ncbi:MAG: Mur ligase domain-containing protein, partial [Gammaproteobacteria bacterium]|nr:Mur ligase domain-containing protein [Gammaproteobacteria bacterium]
MHVHILGICGTFMAGIAALARALGHDVTGSDGAAYPPMSTQLEQLGVTLCAGYEPEHLTPAPDLVVVGNALSRGNPAVEAMLRRGMPYTSGPQWL